jgi:hypothetical protein
MKKSDFMSKLEEYSRQYLADFDLRRIDLLTELQGSVPYLQDKYMKLEIMEKDVLLKMEGELTIYEQKWRDYYLGRPTPGADEITAEFGPFLMRIDSTSGIGTKKGKVLNLELGSYLDSTPSIQIARRSVHRQKEVVRFLSSKVNELAYSANQIKNMIRNEALKMGLGG